MKRNERAKAVTGACIFILALCPSGLARIIYVDNDAPADFSTIQAAIDDANNGDSVIIQPGTYTGPGNRDIRFPGKAVTVQSLDPNDPDTVTATVIDCQGTESDPHNAFYLYSSNRPDSVISGLTIVNGYATNGGAIYCYDYASPTIRNCRLIGNRAMRGGGLYVGNGAPVIRNCLIARNSVSSPSYRGEGGGIYCGITSVTISGCTIVDNSASGHGANPGEGGGILLSDNACVRHCTVLGNVAQAGGGISCNQFGEITIADCIIRSNTAREYAQISGTPAISYSNIEGGWSGPGNIDADPLFINQASGDYHLSAGSPCIDAGDPQYIPYRVQTDVDNEPRVMGLRADMGADEFTSSPTAVLNVYPKQLVFHADVNEPAPERQVLHIENAGFAPLTWAASEDCPWLNTSETPDGTQGLSLGVDVAGLDSGRYDCQVTVQANDVPNSPQVLAMSLYVRAGRYLHVPQPYGTIQSAIEAAQDGDAVVIEPGTYTGPGNRDIDFLGKAITVRSTDPNDPATVAATIIDCQATETQPHRGFIFHNAEDFNSVLAGLTVTRGRTSQGAGVYISGTSPVVYGCNITDNVGTGIYIRGGGPAISKCSITYNESSSWGGGVYCYDGSPVISDCAINANQVKDGGGGIACEYNSILTLAGCAVMNNRVASRVGGGLCLRSSNAVLHHCLIAENQSGSSGGGMYLERGEISVQNCTIVGNTGGGRGGGIYFSLGRLSLQNTIMWANIAHEGPQMAIYSWIGVIYERGLPVGYVPEINAVVDIMYCDVQGGRSPIHIYYDPAYLQLNWNEDNIDADPLFTNPRYSDPNGTPGRGVRSFGAASAVVPWDYHLKSQAGRWEAGSGTWVIDEVTSPCIDAGDPNSPVGDEPEPNGGRINMGAYGGTAEASKSYSGG